MRSSRISRRRREVEGDDGGGMVMCHSDCPSFLVFFLFFFFFLRKPYLGILSVQLKKDVIVCYGVPIEWLSGRRARTPPPSFTGHA